MAIRKNAKFLSPPEKEDFVRACVLMKADIVNPPASPSQRYSRWDENVALHWMIQLGIAPGPVPVNFGHGGSGAYVRRDGGPRLAWPTAARRLRQRLRARYARLAAFVPVQIPDDRRLPVASNRASLDGE